MMPEGCVSKGWISKKQICKFKKQVVMDKLMCACGFALPSHCHHAAMLLPSCCHHIAIPCPYCFHHVAIMLSPHCYRMAITLSSDQNLLSGWTKTLSWSFYAILTITSDFWSVLAILPDGIFYFSSPSIILVFSVNIKKRVQKEKICNHKNPTHCFEGRNVTIVAMHPHQIWRVHTQ